MRVLLDTCVLSEIRRDGGSEAVRAAVRALPADAAWLSVITIGELAGGIARLADGARRQGLAAWLDGLEAQYGARILGIDAEIARIWGRMTAAARAEGHALAVADGLIAATARRHGLGLMTRNVRDFACTGLEILNPWEPAGG